MTINSIGKAFRLLELVGESKSGYTLTELARNLGISMGAAQRITHTLTEFRYLYKEPRTRVFRLTPKFLSFGSAFLSQSEIREISLPFMKKLNEDLDEVVNLGILMDDEEIVYIDRISRTSHILTTNLQVGTRRPIHLSSIGKTILAFLPETERKRILDRSSDPKHPGGSPRSRSELEGQLRDIRKLGYFAGKSELVEGLFILAVPLLNHQGVAAAGINVSIPLSRVSEKKIKRHHIPLLLEAGKNISRALGNAQEKDF